MADNLLHYAVVDTFVDFSVRSLCIYLVYNVGIVSTDRGKNLFVTLDSLQAAAVIYYNWVVVEFY